MIRVEPQPEPPDFDTKVRKDGLRALAELRGQPADGRPGPKRRVKETIESKDLPAVGPASELPADLHARVAATIAILGLDDAECRKARGDWYQPYLDGQISFSFLAGKCPFLAAEIVRQLGPAPEWWKRSQ